MENLRYPVLWIGHIVHGKPEFWKQIKEISIPNFSKKYNVKKEVLNNVIMNAYDLYNTNMVEQISELGNIKSWLDKDVNYVMVDSGGFLFQRKGMLGISPEILGQIYIRVSPDVCVALDHPLDPAQSKFDNIDRIKLTIQNTEKMLEILPDSTNFVPVIHGYTPEMLLASLTKTVKIFEVHKSEPFMYGLGSLVPLMRSIPNMRTYYFKPWELNSARRTALRISYEFRSLLPEKKVHAFGVGYNMMHLLLLLGYDSVDSIGWRMAGARGQILIFNKGARAISPRAAKESTWSKAITEEELTLLQDTCSCPICLADPSKLEKDETARMLHNAYVFLQESLAARLLICENIREYADFLKERFEEMQTKPLFEYALSLISKKVTLTRDIDLKKDYSAILEYEEEDKILDRERVLEQKDEVKALIEDILPLVLNKIEVTDRIALKTALLNSVNWRFIGYVSKSLFESMILDNFLPFIKLKYLELTNDKSPQLLPFLFLSNRLSAISDVTELHEAFINSLSEEELFVLEKCVDGRTIKQLNEESLFESLVLNEAIERLENTALLVLKDRKYFSVVKPENDKILQRKGYKHAIQKIELAKNDVLFNFIWESAAGRIDFDDVIKLLKYVKEKKSVSIDYARKKFGEYAEYVMTACHKVNLLRHHRKISKHYEFPVLKANKIAKLLEEDAKENIHEYILRHPLFPMFAKNMLAYINRSRKNPTLSLFEK